MLISQFFLGFINICGVHNLSIRIGEVIHTIHGDNLLLIYPQFHEQDIRCLIHRVMHYMRSMRPMSSLMVLSSLISSLRSLLILS